MRFIDVETRRLQRPTGVHMELANKAARAAANAVTATTEAAGAVTGAAVGGVLGSVKGVAEGVASGSRAGAHSTPAAAVGLTAVGALGILEWPVVLAVGGTGLVLRQLAPRSQTTSAQTTPARATTDERAIAGDTPRRMPRGRASRAAQKK